MSKLSPKTASVFSLRCEDDLVIPVLVVDDLNGKPKIAKEVCLFMQAMAARGESMVKMRSMATTLALLRDYMLIAKKGEPTDIERLAETLSGFLRRRRRGSTPEDGLDWAPVQRETVERDRRYLEMFAKFCSERFGAFPVGPFEGANGFEEKSIGFRQAMKELKRKDGMLLGHIAPPRKSLAAALKISVGESPALRRRGNGKTFMPRSMIEDLILATPSVSQKLLFIQAAFGGQRVSEILHMWRCDVLPGRMRPVLFPDDKSSDVALVVLAHPSQSIYVGQTLPSGRDRLQHLAHTYKLAPRSSLNADSMRAGWKNMLFDNDRLLISQIFWADNHWAKIYYELFQTLRTKILPQIPVAQRSGHPYLIINDAPNRKEFGRPMKMSNARKSFARACQRIGADEGKYHEGIHGLRHSYKAMIEEIGLAPEEIRKAMHHISPISQESYGKSVSKLNEKMKLLMSGPPQK